MVRDANWRECGENDGCLGNALPSRFATTFSHAGTTLSQVETRMCLTHSPLFRNNQKNNRIIIIIMIILTIIITRNKQKQHQQQYIIYFYYYS